MKFAIKKAKDREGVKKRAATKKASKNNTASTSSDTSN
jgi:hypothetical protein